MRDALPGLAGNPAVPLDLLVTVAAHERLPDEPAPRVESATEAELRSLAGSRVAQVRALVADRTRLPGDLVERLAADPDPGVARRIAARPDLAPSSSPTSWSATARRSSALRPTTRTAPPPCCTARRRTRPRAVAYCGTSPATPPPARRPCCAARRPRTRTWRYAATHPALPVTVLESLLHGPDETLALAAAENPALPETLMRRIIE